MKAKIFSQTTLLIVMIIATVIVTACDDDYNAKSVNGGGGVDITDTSTPVEPIPAELTIVVSGGGRDEPESFEVACGKGQPDTSACDLIARGGVDLFEPVAPDIACTEIYGGNDKAHVTGVIDGQPVETTFSRVNGCEIARWDDVVKLWWPEKVAPASVDSD
jgi:hypothetical protein